MINEFFNTLEKWLDVKVEWASESEKAKIFKLAKTDNVDRRLELVADIGWLDGYAAAFAELKSKVTER